MKKIKLFLCLCALIESLVAQELKLVDQINHSYRISAVSTDPLGHLLIGFSNGVFEKYNSSLTLQSSLSFANNSPITSITAWNPLKYFVFFEETQQIALIERLNTQPRYYPVSDYSNQLILLASPGMDHSIWMVNASNLELLKFNETTKSLIVSIPLKNFEITNPKKILSGKNLLYLIHGNKQFMILDQFGNILQEVKEYEVIDFALFESSIYLLTESNIIKIDAFQKSKGEKINLPSSFDFIEVLSKNKLVLSSQNLTSIYSYSAR